MTDMHPPAPLRDADYDVIEAAVMETEKGRWFLAEFARRHRAADTETVLAAIAGIERLVRGSGVGGDTDRIRLDVGEMKDAIDRTKSEIARLNNDGGDGTNRFERATNELDSIIVQTEAATSEILGAAEKLHEIAFTLREAGADDEVADAVEALVMTIYTACSFQDLTGQRTQKVVHVLRFLETRINAMVEIWGLDAGTASSAADEGDRRPDAHLLNGPALAGEGIDQSDVDDLLRDHAATAAVDLHAGMAALPAYAVEPAGAYAEAFADAPVDIEADTAGTDPDATPGDLAGFAADAATAEFDTDGTDAGGPGMQEDAEGDYAGASAAMEAAIDALREVREAVTPKAHPGDAGADPMQGLTRAERQALFS